MVDLRFIGNWKEIEKKPSKIRKLFDWFCTTHKFEYVDKSCGCYLIMKVYRFFPIFNADKLWYYHPRIFTSLYDAHVPESFSEDGIYCLHYGNLPECLAVANNWLHLIHKWKDE